jgi:NADH-quinone oxidoreductase subunit L
LADCLAAARHLARLVAACVPALDHPASGVPEIELQFSTEVMIAAISTVIAILGWLAARSLYKDKALASDAAFEQRSPALARAIENKWYVDELYGFIVVRPLAAISRFFWKNIDAIIDGLAAMLGYVVRGGDHALLPPETFAITR